MTTELKNSPATYGALFRDRAFRSFLITQFLGAFNDNIYKMLIAGLALHYSVQQSTMYLLWANIAFVAPFLLFSGYAGQIADRYSKSSVLVSTKIWEIGVMVLALLALLDHSHLEPMLGVLFLLGMQATAFSPAKYGILPEIVPSTHLALANGLLDLSTFVAIVAGGALGVLSTAVVASHPMLLGGAMIAIAVIGWHFARGIAKVPPSRPDQPFNFNPLGEVISGNKIVWQHRGLRWSVIGNSFFWAIGGLLQSVLLLYAKDSLHLAESQAGGVVATLAIGIGIGSIVAGRLSGPGVEFGLNGLGSLILGLACVALFPVSHVGMAIPFLVIVGFGGGFFAIPVNMYLQDKAPKQLKGAVQAVNNFWNMIGVIAAAQLLSFLVETLHWSPRAVLMGTGLVSIALAGALVLTMPREHLRIGLILAVRSMFKIRAVGEVPLEGALVLVGNHVSYADAFLIGMWNPRRTHFLMWKVLYDQPWVKPLAKLMDAIPLAQDHPRQALASLQKTRDILKQGGVAGIFPEGGMTRTGQVLPFQSGYQRLLKETDARIVPCYIHGLHGHGLCPPQTRVRNWFWKGRWPVTVYIGTPIDTVPEPAELRDQVLALESRAMSDAAAEGGTLGSALIQAARRNGSAPALADSTGAKLSFRSMLVGALAMGSQLRKEETHVGILLPASVGAALANYAVTLSGKVSVNINFTAGEAHLDYVTKHCGLQTILTSKVFITKAKIAETPEMVFLEDLRKTITGPVKALALLKALFAPVSSLVTAQPNDLASILYSSGSTGTPKGVMLSHANLLSNMAAARMLYRVTTEDSMLGSLPFFHSFGYVYTLWFPILHDFRVAYHANPTDAKKIGELAAEHQVTFLLTTPTFAQAYVRRVEPAQFGHLKYVLVGAEKLRLELAHQFKETFGVDMQEGYGCTEMAPTVSVNAPFFGPNTITDPQTARKPGTVGRPMPGIICKIVDPETYEPLPVGQPGLLLTGGPSRMLGYWKDEARTQASLRDGLYVTGDIVKIDEDGFLTITDRLARFSKIGGEMISHLRIEEIARQALEERQVDDVQLIVMGVPDASKGERLVLMYTGTQDLTSAIWQKLQDSDLPSLSVPKQQDFFRIDAIPTLGTGKVDLRATKKVAAELVEKLVVAKS